MKINIKVNENDYFIKLLLILNNIPPFDKLRPKELELYSHLLTINYKYRNIPFKERNTLIFNYDTKQELARKMKIKPTGVYNIMSNLRVLKIIENDSLIPKYILGKTNTLTFVFSEDE
jgi:hypothetical protein